MSIDNLTIEQMADRGGVPHEPGQFHTREVEGSEDKSMSPLRSPLLDWLLTPRLQTPIEAYQEHPVNLLGNEAGCYFTRAIEAFLGHNLDLAVMDVIKGLFLLFRGGGSRGHTPRSDTGTDPAG